MNPHASFWSEPHQPRHFLPDGRLVVPDFGRQPDGSGLSPHQAGGMLADVLRKRVDVKVGERYEWQPMTPQNIRDPRYELWLDVPFDAEWLLARAVLPAGVSIFRDSSSVEALDLWGEVVASKHKPDDPRWVAVGWRQGEPFDAPLPDLARTTVFTKAWRSLRGKHA